MTTKEVRIKDELLKVGIRPNLGGFAFLTTALLDYSPRKKLCGNCGLYQYIATLHGSTASKVERAIRHAIQTAGELTTCSNSEFLATIDYRIARSEALANEQVS